MRARYLVMLSSGLEPGPAHGPVRGRKQEEALILWLMTRTDSDLGDEGGEDVLLSVEIGRDGRPELGTYTGGFMGGLRDRAELAKRAAEADGQAEVSAEPVKRPRGRHWRPGGPQ